MKRLSTLHDDNDNDDNNDNDNEEESSSAQPALHHANKRRAVTNAFFQGAVSALDLWSDNNQAEEDDSLPPSRSISTGSASVDRLLSDSSLTDTPTCTDDGIAFGRVTEVFGSAGSGKTQLALTAAVHAARHDIVVYYIGASTTGSVARRLRQVAVSLLHATEDKVRRLQVVQLLHRIVLWEASDGHALLARLQTVESHLREGGGGGNVFLIVDSVSGMLAPTLCNFAADGGVGTCLVQQVALTLRSLSRTELTTLASMEKEENGERRRRCAVLVTNASVSGGRKPALGRHWQEAADVRLLLETLRDEVPQPVAEAPGLTLSCRRWIQATKGSHTAAVAQACVDASGMTDVPFSCNNAATTTGP